MYKSILTPPPSWTIFANGDLFFVNTISIDELVNPDRLKMTKCVRYFEDKFEWFIEYKRFLFVGTQLDSIT